MVDETTAHLGRLRGLAQIATSRGVLAIVACDQRSAFARLLQAAGRTDDAATIAQCKLDIVRELSPVAGGMLLDPEYGVGPCIEHGALAGSCGLIVALEASGYDAADPDRLARLLDGWDPARIRALGAAAIKLLVYFNPRRERAAARQLALVEDVVGASHALGLPVVLECLVFPTRDAGDPAAFRAEREALVVESARVLNELEIDLYKAEFPLLPEQTDDEGEWRASCARLNAACRAPWALLSAGVSFERFARQLECACQAGASGFIAGRAIWQEAVTTVDPGARARFLRGEMVERLRRLTAIAEAHARPYNS